MNYIKQDDIEVAVKSIAFDNNNQSLHITPQPHFMIVQEVTAAEEHAYIQFMKTRLNKKGEKSGIEQDLRSVKTLEDIIELLGKNYVAYRPKM